MNNLDFFQNNQYGILTEEEVTLWLNNVIENAKTALEIETEFQNYSYNESCNRCLQDKIHEKCENCNEQGKSNCFNNFYICEKIMLKLKDYKKTCSNYDPMHRLNCASPAGCSRCMYFNLNIAMFCEGCTDPKISKCNSRRCRTELIKTECVKCSNKDNLSTMEKLMLELDPTYTFETYSGVSEIKTDGSLCNGLEITTPGLKYDYNNNYKIYKKICDTLIKHKAYTNGACGGHIHLLIDYSTAGNMDNGIFIKSSVGDVPGIIFANLYQLSRIFLPCIAWITTTVQTRGYGYRRFTNLLKRSPLKYENIEQFVKNVSFERYLFLNSQPLRVRDESKIKAFHVEYRIADGCLSPSVWLAWTTLYTALLMKAVKISKNGLLFSRKWTYEDMMRRLWDENTYRLSEEIKQDFTARTKEMLDFLKKEILTLSPKAWAILNKLAEKPVAFYGNGYRSINGEEWRKIEKEYSANDLNDTLDKVTDIQRKLKLIIESYYLTGLSKSRWVQTAGQLVGTDYVSVTKILDELGVEYDEQIGAYEIAS